MLKLFNTGDYEECLRECNALLLLNSESYIAYKYAWRSLVALGNIEQAEICINKIIQFKTKSLVRGLLQKPRILLEIGAGNKKGRNGWITLDTDLGADIQWDLRNGIPFPDKSIDMIYTSHTFEHIPFLALQRLLGECLRTLKVNGRLSVSVPNARYYIQSYLNSTNFVDVPSGMHPHACNTGSTIDQLNYIAYMGREHCYMFDEENLVNILLLSGFSSSHIREFDSSLDLAERDFESVYAVAIK